MDAARGCREDRGDEERNLNDSMQENAMPNEKATYREVQNQLVRAREALSHARANGQGVKTCEDRVRILETRCKAM